MNVEKFNRRYIITGIVGAFYFICLILNLTGIVKGLSLVSAQVIHKTWILPFAVSVVLALISAIVIDRVISSEKIKLWRIGLAFGFIGLLLSKGLVKKDDGIAEITLAVLVGFWGYAIAGILIGWIVDRWRNRKL